MKTSSAFSVLGALVVAATSLVVAATSLVVAATLASATLVGQAPAEGGASWKAPRTPDGRPDLAGIWEHNAATPIERPDELKGRAVLTDEEVGRMTSTAARLFGGDGDAAFGDAIYIATLRNVLGAEKGFSSRDAATGDYNSFWITGRWFEKRTSLIADPPTGKIPALTPQAQARRAAAAERRKLHAYDGPEDVPLSERCVTGGVPMLGAGYNNYYQIVQTPATVAINMEMRHDTRMIPVGSRPHLPKGVQLWLGDPVGRWEGETFVVDTTNFRDDAPVAGGGASANLHVIERFTRVAPETLKYEATLDDPSTWVKPWTAVLYMKKTTDPIFEYACHEGNSSMFGSLNGARVQERKAREKIRTTGTSSGGN